MHEILKTHQKFWLPRENLTLILNHFFSESRCCSVYINNETTKEELILFNSFVSVYQSEYFIGIRNNECLDYLLIASQDQQIIKSLSRIPVVMPKTRILSLINSRLDSNSSLFNVSMYKNSNINIVSQSGLYILSENYLKPRTFNKIEGKNVTQWKSKIVDLKARELHVSTFYNPPYCFLKTLVNKTINEIPTKIFLMNKNEEMDGIELKIFQTIAKILNFKYTLRSPIGLYNHGRKYNDTAWNGGMIAQIVKKEVDIAFGSIWINKLNNEFVNITEPWTQIFIHFLVPRPQPYTSFWALTRTLSLTVWLVLIAVIILETAYVYGKAWINPFVPKHFRNIIVTFTEVMGRMLGTWLPRNAPQLKLHFLLWEVTGLIIVTSYSSSLAARLTNPEFEQRIDRVEQFIEKNLTWGRSGTPPDFKEYFNMEDKYAKQMPSRFILEKSVQDRIQYVLKGNHAVIGRIVGKVYYPEGDISDKALKKLRVMQQPVAQFYTGFAVQPWLLEPVNKVMMRLKESGIVLYHLKDVINRRTGIHLREVFTEYDKLNFNRAIVLTLNPLGVGFASLIFGLFLASLIFCIEARFTKKRENSLNIFKTIRQKCNQ